ncbi:hypothetical protein E4U61_004196 [Claviceps capensis]|nr:hypothetical protein E4U61_004196 [Claviceps capensis]
MQRDQADGAKSSEAYMDDCLDDMSDENLPTGTAAKFAAATSRDSARKLLGGIFSLDQFQYVFRFSSEILDGGRPQRSAFPAQGARHNPGPRSG